MVTIAHFDCVQGSLTLTLMQSGSGSRCAILVSNVLGLGTSECHAHAMQTASLRFAYITHVC